MKTNYLLTSCILLSLNVFSQTPLVKDTSWKSGGLIAVNFSQVNLSQWSAGGENTMSLNTSINLYSNYLKGKNDWQNTLDFGYAFLKTATGGVNKSDDRIEFTSKYGKKLARIGFILVLPTSKVSSHLATFIRTIVQSFRILCLQDF